MNVRYPGHSFCESLSVKFHMNLAEVLVKMDCVFSVIASGLGDIWATVSTLLRLSEQEGRISSLNPLFIPIEDEAARGERRASPRDMTSLINEVIPCFDSTGRIALTYLHPNATIERATAYGIPFLPCRIRWQPSASRKVCFHLSGIHNGVHKNVPDGEQQRFATKLSALGFEPQALGLPLTLEESISHLSNCLCFVGVDSGLMHVAYSVGTPRFMVKNHMPLPELFKCHITRTFILCDDIWEAVTKLQELDASCAVGPEV